jgi:hypothetical protein
VRNKILSGRKSHRFLQATALSWLLIQEASARLNILLVRYFPKYFKIAKPKKRLTSGFSSTNELASGNPKKCCMGDSVQAKGRAGERGT